MQHAWHLIIQGSFLHYGCFGMGSVITSLIFVCLSPRWKVASCLWVIKSFYINGLSLYFRCDLRSVRELLPVSGLDRSFQ